MTQASEETKTVFFGIMKSDMWGSEELAKNVDADASITRYGELCEKAIIEGFAKYDETVTVDWESQDVGGAVPWGLETKINGDTSHEDCEFVNTITDDVWQDWEWEVII